MIELIQITNDPAFARRCDALQRLRLMVDLERLGKAERQAGRNTFISTHDMEDVARIRQVLRRSQLMVRVNPLHPGSPDEVDGAIARGAHLLMLPMFTAVQEVRAFSEMVAGRAGIVPLLETAQALGCLDDWIDTPGLAEIYVGLNDLHLSLGQRFMFEPLADGRVDGVASAARNAGLRFGFGGIARLNEGLLPGRDVLAEHLRLGSSCVILSRTFHGGLSGSTLEEEVAALRRAEAELAVRTSDQIDSDRERIAATIRRIAAGMIKPA